MKKIVAVGLLAGLAVPVACSGERDQVKAPFESSMVDRGAKIHGERGGVPLYRKEILSPVYTVDQIYSSMKGPISVHRFAVDAEGPRELVWITGFEAVMVGPDGSTPMSQEFMCHSNLTLIDEGSFRQSFPTALTPSGGRLFSLAQGQLSIELPEGFGVPAMSNETIQLAAQVLNHNVLDETVEVRHRITIDFVRDRDLDASLTPLFPRAAYGLKLVRGNDGFYGFTAEEVEHVAGGQGCLIGQDAGGGRDGRFSHLVDDGQGRSFTGFWILKPGREENHTPVTKLLELPYDTSLHYVAVHLHPYAESVELLDLTTGESVYKSRARQTDGAIGLAEVQHFSSTEGIPLYKDHDYELVSVYENSSGEDQDSMATMFLYLVAKDLELAHHRQSRGG